MQIRMQVLSHNSWLVGDVHREVIEVEVTGSTACHIDHTDAEIGIAEVGYIPGTAPRITYTAEGIGGFRCS